MFLGIEKRQSGRRGPLLRAGLLSAAVASLAGVGSAEAYTSEDGSLKIDGFVENATYTRRHVGLSKMRNTLQLEGSKDYGEQGAFSNVSFVGTFRATYDAVYDLNKDHFGDEAGGPIQLQSVGGSGETP